MFQFSHNVDHVDLRRIINTNICAASVSIVILYHLFHTT
jgi:hypothetical protein